MAREPFFANNKNTWRVPASMAQPRAEVADDPKAEDLLIEPRRPGHIIYVERGLQDSFRLGMHIAQY
jgi:hypothetical protein